MASLLYKNTGIDMTLALVGEKIDRNRFTGEKVENSTFFNCDFSGADLSGTEFIGCQFYDRESQKGCNFSRAMLKMPFSKAVIYQWQISATSVPWALKFATAAHKAQISAVQAL